MKSDISSFGTNGMKAILFDLDGTLLPMQQDEFTAAYFDRLSKKLAPCGYEPERLIEGVWQDTNAMVKNNGEQTNEQVFRKEFAGLSLSTIAAIAAAIGYFMEKIYPLFGLMGV